MDKITSEKPIPWLTTKRIEALVDGVFAISMTLLVVNFHIPTVTQKVANELPSKLMLSFWPNFLSYAISFILLAVFWMIHHKQFRSIKRVNEPFLWINILGLMFIALIPFSTYLLGEYGELRPTVLLFECNMLIIGLIFYIQWWYASSKHRLIDANVSSREIIAAGRKSLLVPITSLFAITVSLFIPQWGPLVYLLIPFLHKTID